MTYNFNRSHEARHRRLDELEARRVPEGEATCFVLPGSDAYYGHLNAWWKEDAVFFRNLRTARAYANHLSDCCDRNVGLFSYPGKFICGICNR